jgi:uncharacterized OB-fold protein
MTPGLAIQRCLGCGAGYFPARLLCPRCHGAAFGEARVDRGTVEETTTIRHVLSHSDWQPRCLASVRTCDGQLIVAGLQDPLPDGMPVDLWQDGMAPYATPSVG